MSIPFLSVKPRAIKLKVSPRFPAQLIGRAGVDVTKQNGDYYLDLDFNDFPVISSIPPGTTYALIFNPATGQYAQMPVSLLGGGIPDAPNDGQLYGRKSLAWSVVPAGGGGGILDAPIDGTTYGRNSAAWINVPARVDVREKLVANRTYYVRSDGSDANNGLTNTAGGAFLTVQKAVDVCAQTIDFGGFTVAITLGAGSFAGWNFRAMVGLAGVTFLQVNGAGVTTIINSTISCAGPLTMGLISNMHIAAGAANVGLNTAGGGFLAVGAGVTYGANVYLGAASGGSVINLTGGFTVTASCTFGFYVSTNSKLLAESFGTCTITGNPAWAGGFIYAENGSAVRIPGNTFTGASTGLRYQCVGNATIFTSGAGATYLPGSINGTPASGGQYL